MPEGMKQNIEPQTMINSLYDTKKGNTVILGTKVLEFVALLKINDLTVAF